MKPESLPARLSVAALLVLSAGVGHAGSPAAPLSFLESDSQAIDVALESVQPGPASQAVYISTTASAATMGYNRFVRNTGLWIGPKVDLSAISAFADPEGNYGTKFAITAISPMHCLCAFHAAPKIGGHYNFVGMDNVTVTRTVVAVGHAADDVGVVLLNQPLPPGITPLRLLPKNWRDYLPVNTRLDLPGLFVNQHNLLYVAEVDEITAGPTPMAVCHFPTGYVRQQFNTQIISGDSSFPLMVMVNGQPAILALWHYGGYGIGPVEAAYFDQIDATMRQLSKRFGFPPLYQLKPANLKDFAKVTGA